MENRNNRIEKQKDYLIIIFLRGRRIKLMRALAIFWRAHFCKFAILATM